MCGIVGIVAEEPVDDRSVLLRMRDSMTHRGPDDCGAWWSADGRVGWAHRRLAIVDLSAAGCQPMSNRDGLHVVFNGELYNFRDLRDELRAAGHRFQTATDTEVILAAYRQWGPACLARFIGMFAFGVYDARRERVFLARDRAGEKPLFYWRRPGLFLFASELKALLAHPACPRRLDGESLEHYLAFGYVPGSRCMLREVRKLPQGHSLDLEIQSGRVEVRRYWSLPKAPSAPTADSRELTDRLERLLESSVRMQLQAHVPVGVLLSGGIDSSLITALAARVSSRPLKTFTVAFPDHAGFDESPHARQVARHFGTDHTELVAAPSSVDLLPTLAAQFDEPLADSSMVPTYLISRLIREHATVALGGDGGDELFGGYPHYQRLLHMQRQRWLLPRPVRALLGVATQRLLPVGVRGRNYLLALMSDEAASVGRLNVYFDAVTRRRLLVAPTGCPELRGAGPEQEKVRTAGAGSLLRRATTLDFATYLVDDILVKVDRSSMLASLEVRAPFLDYRIVEFAFGEVPDDLRATGSEKKVLLKRLARRLLPPQFNLTRKQGFSIPLDRWFDGSWGAFMEEVLSEADETLFDRRAIRQLIAGQRRGRTNAQRLFALTIFELWRRHYRVTL